MKMKILLAFLLINCSTVDKNQINKKCLDIHNSGVDIINRANYNDTIQIKNAIDVFKESIDCEPAIFLSYMMKIKCHFIINDRFGIYETCKLYQENSQEDSPFIFFYLGDYYENIDKLDSSQYYFDRAISLVDKKFLDNRSSENLFMLLLMNRLIMSNQHALELLDKNIDLLKPDEIKIYKEFLGKSKTEIIYSQ